MTRPKYFTLVEGHLVAVAATEELLKFELHYSKYRFGDFINPLFALLQVPVPAYWPPKPNDNESYRHFLTMIQSDPDAKTWGAYYLIDLGTGRRLIGCGGFIAPPDNSGTVEIECSILKNYLRQGYASGLCRMLVKHAFSDSRVTRVIANPDRGSVPSIGVLRKNGFLQLNENENRTITFELSARKR
jgi:RimJ/RimL family protein N-acetyltransferase